MSEKITHRKLDTPTYKITGKVRDGRWDTEKQDWFVRRMIPRYFHTLGHAEEFFDSNNVHIGTLWKLVDSMTAEEYKYRTQQWKPKGAYGIIRLKNMSWGLGIRGTNPKGNNQHTAKEELARVDPNNSRYGNKYPSSKYNQWLKDGAKKEKEKKK